MELLSLCVRAEHSARKIYTIREHTRFEPRRFHGFVLYLTGACEYVYGATRFVAVPGSFLVLPRGLRYSIHPIADNSSCLLIDFDADFDGPLEAYCKQLEAPETVERLFDAAIQAARRNEANRRALIFSALYQIAALVEAPPRYVGSAQRDRLQGAMTLLRQDFDKRALTVGALAAACGVSEKHFQALFRDAYHMPPKQYMLSLRLDKAKRLLASTDEAVGDVAMACGFASVYYFSRAFKARTLLTPSEWRRQAGIT